MKIYTLICLILISFSSYAQNDFTFRHIDIIDGLSDNQIRGLGQTSDARISIRTTTSLNLYNGATIDYFYPTREKSINGAIHISLKNTTIQMVASG